MKIHLYIFLVFLSLLHSVSLAQDEGRKHPILDNFDAFEDHGRVILQWTIARGNTCLGIGIFRSTDSINYLKIGGIEGICGDFENPVTYVHLDDFPVSGELNYYRLELGFQGFSIPVVVDLREPDKESVLVYPNPTSSVVNVKIQNSGEIQYVLQLHDSQGRFLIQLPFQNDEIYFDIGSFFASHPIFPAITNLVFYTVRTSSGKQISTGKLLVSGQ
jgi:hypothetical protein